MPQPDLAQLWEDHTREDACINHIPVLTGGSGKTNRREPAQSLISSG